MYPTLYSHHKPVRSFFCAIGVLCLFLAAAPLLVIQAETIPVFSNWKNQPLPSGNPMKVQYFLNGTYYDTAIETLVFQIRQLDDGKLLTVSL